MNIHPEQEINRIKREYKEHWARLETYPQIQKAITDEDPIKLGEIAARLIYGGIPSKEELESSQSDYEYYEGIKRRQKLINERKESSN